MIVGAVAWAFIASRMDNREPVYIYPPLGEQAISQKAMGQKAAAENSDEVRKDKNRRRKLRNKLK
jgi:hypothetical protein